MKAKEFHGSAMDAYKAKQEEAVKSWKEKYTYGIDST